MGLGVVAATAHIYKVSGNLGFLFFYLHAWATMGVLGLASAGEGDGEIDWEGSSCRARGASPFFLTRSLMGV
jgi:hypothetical protein